MQVLPEQDEEAPCTFGGSSCDFVQVNFGYNHLPSFPQVIEAGEGLHVKPGKGVMEHLSPFI